MNVISFCFVLLLSLIIVESVDFSLVCFINVVLFSLCHRIMKRIIRFQDDDTGESSLMLYDTHVGDLVSGHRLVSTGQYLSSRTLEVCEMKLPMVELTEVSSNIACCLFVLLIN